MISMIMALLIYCQVIATPYDFGIFIVIFILELVEVMMVAMTKDL